MTEEPDRSYRDFIGDRAMVAVDVISAIFFDALVFCFWLLCAWGALKLSEIMHQQGVSDILANTFKWCSSVATFILTISYIAIDVIKAIKRIKEEMNNK